MIGTHLGRYRILDEIGAGGMGVVYRAEDERLGRVVAIKVLPAGRLAAQETRSRFSREALLLSRLNHPNIATVYDFDSRDDLDLLVMEYIPGDTLSDRLKTGPLEEPEIARLGTQLAEGLAVAHENGVLHRDLKPGNLKILPDGRLKILDFGLAKWVHPTADNPDPAILTQTQEVMGTPAYMAPELLRGEPADVRSDLYAVGIVLYEMATGRRPFQDLAGFPLAHAIVNQPPPRPSELHPGISPALESIVLRAIDQDPARRHTSARELEQDLLLLGTPEAETISRPATARAVRVPWVALGALLAVALAVVGYLMLRGPGASGPPRTLLAVLPFENLTSDPEQEYFSDGLTEEMIARLGKLDPTRVGVIARTSAMQYKRTRKPLRRIGHELGVKYVLAGSVRRAADRVRIVASLGQVEDQTELWSHAYERNLADVFAIQSEVADSIAQALAIDLLPARKREIARAETARPDAHEAYLKGRYFWNARSEEGYVKSIESFRRAIALDPKFALAHAGLADAYLLQGTYGFVGLEEAMPAAKAEAEKALALDPRLAAAHATLASVAEQYERNWTAATRHYRRAIELDPGYATAHQWYGGYLLLSARTKDAVAELERALTLDPLSLGVNVDLASGLYYARRFDEAIARSRKALELDSTSVPALTTLGLAALQAGDGPQTIAALQRAMTISGAAAADTEALANAYRAAGAPGLWRWKLGWLENQARQDRANPYELATAHAALGEKDRAFEWLELTYRKDPDALATIKVEVLLDGLRSDPRYRALLERLRLPPG